MTVVHYHSQQPQNSIALDMEVPLYEVSVLLCSLLCMRSVFYCAHSSVHVNSFLSLCDLVTLCELNPLLCERMHLLCELVPLRELVPMSV